MAKLNVTYPAVDVMVDGQAYRKVDRKAQAGDIVKVKYSVTDVDRGAFYLIEADSNSALFFRDNAGDERYRLENGHSDSYEVYEAVAPVIAETSDEITFEGAQYRKVDRSAREGDVIVYTEAPYSYITQGKPYAVTEIDYADDAQITDDDGDDFDTCGHEFDVYEKVSVESAVGGAQYREVKRQARAGETIKMTDDDGADGWAEGDTFIVSEIDSDGDAVFKDNDGDTRYKDTDYYVVLEPVNAQATAEPKRLTVGDYVKVVREGGVHNYAIGSVVKATWTDGDTLFYAEKADGSTGNMLALKQTEPATEAEFLAQRKPAEPVRLNVGDFAKVTQSGHESQGSVVVITGNNRTGSYIYSTENIDGTPADIFALDGVIAATAEEVSAAQAEAQRKLAIGPFAGGGFAVVVDVCKSDCVASSIRNGDYVKVAVTEVDGPYALELVSYGEKSAYSFCNADALRQITEEEYNAATKPKPAPLSVGDYVRITRARYSGDSLKIGEVRKISKVDGSFIPYKADKLDGSDHDWFIEGTLVKLTAEEAQEIARWAKINRKVGEFKVGDIVEATHKSSGTRLTGVLIDLEREDSPDLGITSYVDGKYRAVYTEGATLIVPVEQRFDTAA